MGRDEIIETLRSHMAEIRITGSRVWRLAVFGSCVRGEERPGSDVDILVELTMGDRH